MNGQRGTGIEEVFDTEGKRRVIQQAPPTRAMPLRRNRFFSNDPLPFFVVPGFWGFRRDLDRRTKLIRNLPVNRSPVANQMDVTVWMKLSVDFRNGPMSVVGEVQLRALVVQSEAGAEEVTPKQVFR